jgi:hypothetical protein
MLSTMNSAQTATKPVEMSSRKMAVVREMFSSSPSGFLVVLCDGGGEDSCRRDAAAWTGRGGEGLMQTIGQRVGTADSIADAGNGSSCWDGSVFGVGCVNTFCENVSGILGRMEPVMLRSVKGLLFEASLWGSSSDCGSTTAKSTRRGASRSSAAFSLDAGVNSFSNRVVSVAACLLAVLLLLTLAFPLPLLFGHGDDRVLAAAARMLIISIFSYINCTETMREVGWLFAELIRLARER